MKMGKYEFISLTSANGWMRDDFEDIIKNIDGEIVATINRGDTYGFVVDTSRNLNN